MRVILANPRGFCAGVNMAIESLEKAVELYGTPLYVYHEIVHNRHVVERFRAMGVVFVDRPEEVPEGGTLMYSAHGVSPEIRDLSRRRRLRTIDATCPLVTKVHLEAQKFAKEGFTICLVGHEGHDEVIGTIGEAPDHIRLVESEEQAARLEVEDESKVAYLTQTTLSVDDAERIIAALRRRFPLIQGPPKEDICYATQNRQEAVKEIAPEATVVLVLGSQNSSNSQRLREIAELEGKRAYLIDSIDELDFSVLSGDDVILVTAGASAPETVVQECVDRLRDRFGASVESRTVREESVHFRLPRELTMVAAPSMRSST